MPKLGRIGKLAEARNLELSLLRTFLALVQRGSMGRLRRQPASRSPP